MKDALRYLFAFIACVPAATLAYAAPKSSTGPILYAASQGGLTPGDSAIYQVTTRGVSVLVEEVGETQKMAVNAQGTLFAAEPAWDSGDRIWMIPRGSTLATFFEFKDANGSANGRASPYGIALAPDGTVYTAANPDYTVYSQTIYAISPQSVATTVAAIDGGIMSLSRSPAGDLFAAVSYFSLHQILKVTPTGGVSVVIDGLPNMPRDAQIGPDGDLYLVIMGADQIYRWDLDSATPVLAVFADISSPLSLAFDSAGYLYVGQGGGRVSMVDPQGNVSLIASGFRGGPITGIAVSCTAPAGKGKPKPCFSVRSPVTGP